MAKSTRKLTCPECGKVCSSMGLVNHIRLKHNLKIKEKAVEVERDKVVQLTAGIIEEAIESVVAKKASEELKMPYFNPYHERVVYYRRHPDKAQEEWQKLQEIQVKYGWVKTQFPDMWNALEQVCVIDPRNNRAID